MSQRKRLLHRFGTRYPRYGNEVSHLARALSNGDADLADDLLQVGLVTLWLADEDLGAKINDWKVLKQRVRWRMMDVLRQQRQRATVLQLFVASDQTPSAGVPRVRRPNIVKSRVAAVDVDIDVDVAG